MWMFLALCINTSRLVKFSKYYFTIFFVCYITAKVCCCQELFFTDRFGGIGVLEIHHGEMRIYNGNYEYYLEKSGREYRAA